MPSYNYLEEEIGKIELKIVGHYEDPASAWSTHSTRMQIVDWSDNSLVDTVSGLTVGTATANSLDSTLYDFLLSANLPAGLSSGHYYLLMQVISSSGALVHTFPRVKHRLTLRVWPDTEAAEDTVGSKTYTQAGHSLATGEWVYRTAGGVWAKAQADDADTLAEGIITATTTDGLTIWFGGILDYTTHGKGSVGDTLYLSASTAGSEASSPPSPGNYAQQLATVVTADQLNVNIGEGTPT